MKISRLPLEIDKQKDDKKLSISIGIDNINFGDNSLFIYQPRYKDEARQILKAIVKFPDGSLKEMEANKHDKQAPLIRDIMLQYSEAEVEMYTHRERCMLVKRAELEKRMREDKARSIQREETFQAKAKALELPEIKSSDNKELKKKIRRAKNSFEVMAYTVSALAKK